MLEYMNIAISRSGLGYPPSAAWYPGVSTESFGAQPVPSSTPQWFQQGPVGVQNYPPSIQGSIPVVGPKMECVSGTVAIRNDDIPSVRHMCVNLSQRLQINFTGEVGDVKVNLAAALKRAEEAEGRAERLALDAQERGNKCDALRKRCRSLKDELRNSKAATIAAEERVAQSVLLVKEAENKADALRKRMNKLREELKLGQGVLEEMRKSGTNSFYFLNIA